MTLFIFILNINYGKTKGGRDLFVYELIGQSKILARIIIAKKWRQSLNFACHIVSSLGTDQL